MWNAALTALAWWHMSTSVFLWFLICDVTCSNTSSCRQLYVIFTSCSSPLLSSKTSLRGKPVIFNTEQDTFLNWLFTEIHVSLHWHYRRTINTANIEMQRCKVQRKERLRIQLLCCVDIMAYRNWHLCQWLLHHQWWQKHTAKQTNWSPWLQFPLLYLSKF